MVSNKCEEFGGMVTQIKENIKRLLLEGYIEEAETIAFELLKMESSYDVDSIYSTILILKEDFHNAEQILLSSIEKYGETIDSLFNLGFIYEQINKPIESLKSYTNALRLGPDSDTLVELNEKIQHLEKEYSISIEDEFNGNPEGVNKILFIQSIPDIRTNKIAQILKDFGLQVDMLYAAMHPQEVYKNYQLPYSNIFQIKSIPDSIQFIEDSDYDLLYSCNEPDYLSSLFANTSKPIIHDCHDMMSLRGDLTNEQIIHEFLANTLCDGNIYVTRYVKQIAERNFNIKNKPVLVLDNYILRSQMPQKYLKKLSEIDGEIHCVYEGGLTNFKDHHRDIEGFINQLTNLKIHVHLYPSFDNAHYEMLASNNKYLHYEGVQPPDALITQLTQYDIGLVILNVNDRNKVFLDTTFPNKAWDYLAAGLPLFCSDLKSFNDFIDSNKVGQIYNPALDLKTQVLNTSKIKVEKSFLADNDYLMDAHLNELLCYFSEVVKKKTVSSKHVDLTVVIPTKDRPDRLRECLCDFLSKNDENFTVRCTVLDSSNDENNKSIQNLIKEIDTDRKLIDLYKFDESQAFWEKIEFGVSKANSEYCLICADDDFFTKDGIGTSVDILRANSEVITVRGYTGVFFDRNSYEVYLKEIDNPYDILGGTSLERLNELVRTRLVQLVYSVYRTSDLKKVLRALINSEKFVMLSPVFQEYMFYYTVAVLGKVQAIDILTNIRESSAESGSSTVSNFYHSICDDSFNENYSIFKESIMKLMGENGFSLSNPIEFDLIFEQFMVNSLKLPCENIRFYEGMLDTKKLHDDASCYI